MNQAKQLSRSALWLITGLNAIGVLSILSCNVVRLGCEMLYAWYYATLYVSIPALVLAFFAAPAGTFQAKTLARRLLWGNVFFWALLLALAVQGTFFR